MKFLTILLLFFLLTCSSPVEPKEQSLMIIKDLQREDPWFCGFNDNSETRHFKYIDTSNSFMAFIITNIYPWSSQPRDWHQYDEIGIFHNKECVGAITLCDWGNTFEIIAKAPDDGWEGDTIVVKYFDYSINLEISIVCDWWKIEGFNYTGCFQDNSYSAVKLYRERIIK